VQDDGPGFDHKLTTYGVGLSNTVARLEALYAGAAQFSVGAGGDGASVHIDMPLRQPGDAA
jgi:signal transduction histidine kinase